MVQPRSPRPQRRPVRRSQTALDQRTAPQGHGRRCAGGARRRAITAAGRSAAGTGQRPAGTDLRLVQRPLPHHPPARKLDPTVARANWAQVFYADVTPAETERALHVTEAIAPALDALADALSGCEWNRPAIAAAFKQVLASQGLKMPQLAMPTRVLTVGTAHTPSVDALLELM